MEPIKLQSTKLGHVLDGVKRREEEPKKRPPTQLWDCCERVAEITGTQPRRWLRYGKWAIDRSLIDLAEKKDCTNKAAYLTFLITKVHGKKPKDTVVE